MAEDLSFVIVKLLDNEGNLWPRASNNISFQLSGAGTNRGVAKGDATNTQILTVNEMQHFNGQFAVVIHSSDKTGTFNWWHPHLD